MKPWADFDEPDDPDNQDEHLFDSDDEISPDDAERYALPPPLVGDRAWIEEARCRKEKMPTRAFYVDRQRTLDVLALRVYCRDCPVRWECLEFAILNGDRYGVWGGYVDKERRKIRRLMEAGNSIQRSAEIVRNLDALPASVRRKSRIAREG